MSIQCAVELALSEAKTRSHVELNVLREQLSAQHSRRETLLVQQVQQLEEKLVNCLKEQDRKVDRGRGVGGASVERIQQLFQMTLSSLKKDMVAIVS